MWCLTIIPRPRWWTTGAAAAIAITNAVTLTDYTVKTDSESCTCEGAFISLPAIASSTAPSDYAVLVLQAALKAPAALPQLRYPDLNTRKAVCPAKYSAQAFQRWGLIPGLVAYSKNRAAGRTMCLYF